MNDKDVLIGGSFEIDLNNLTRDLNKANKLIALSNSEFKNATAGMDKFEDRASILTASIKNLNDRIDLQTKRVNAMKQRYQELADKANGEVTPAMMDLQQKINNETGKLNTNKKALKDNTQALEELNKKTSEASNRLGKLNTTINNQESELKDLKKEYTNVVLEQGKTSSSAIGLANKIKTLDDELKQNKSKLNEAEKATEDLTPALNNAKDGSEKLGDGFTILKGVAANLIADGIKRLASSLVDLAKESVNTGIKFESAFAGRV